MYRKNKLCYCFLYVIVFFLSISSFLKATQRLQKGDSCPLVPMKYGDSPTESKPPAQSIEPQKSNITGITTMQYSRK